MAEGKGVQLKKIAAAKTMCKLLADHFCEPDRAAKEGHPKVAWCTSVGPAELLRALGCVVYWVTIPRAQSTTAWAIRTARSCSSWVTGAERPG
jgi:hypothetical protein